jgi:hypothetical protein
MPITAMCREESTVGDGGEQDIMLRRAGSGRSAVSGTGKKHHNKRYFSFVDV